MTPQYLLEQALARFPILLIKDELKQERYLRDALQFYSQHSGIIMRLQLEQPEVLITPKPLAFNGIYNIRGEWCRYRYDEISNYLHVLDDVRNGPWSMSYFVNVVQWDLNVDLPNDLEYSLIIDLIESLVGEANAQALSMSKFLANLESMEGKQPSEYHQQREAVEQQIRESAQLPDFALI